MFFSMVVDFQIWQAFTSKTSAKRKAIIHLAPHTYLQNDKNSMIANIPVNRKEF